MRKELPGLADPWLGTLTDSPLVVRDPVGPRPSAASVKHTISKHMTISEQPGNLHADLAYQSTTVTMILPTRWKLSAINMLPH